VIVIEYLWALQILPDSNVCTMFQLYLKAARCSACRDPASLVSCRIWGLRDGFGLHCNRL